MGKIKKERHIHYQTSRFIGVFTLLIISLTLSSCSAIGEIFKAGMSFGIFIVVAIIVVAILLFLRIGKKKNS